MSNRKYASFRERYAKREILRSGILNLSCDAPGQNDNFAPLHHAYNDKNTERMVCLDLGSLVVKLTSHCVFSQIEVHHFLFEKIKGIIKIFFIQYLHTEGNLEL